jgi:hypothetical protein
MYQHNDHNDEIFDGLDPEDQAMADLLQRARFAPTPAYQADLWQQLRYRQNRQDERRNNMSRSRFPRFVLRFGLIGVTAAVSAAMVLVILLVGSLVISPTARAQAQQLIARFIEVDSPEDFLAEQIREQRAALEAKENDVVPADDQAASAKTGEVVESSGSRAAPSLPDELPALRDIETRPDNIPLPVLQSSALPGSMGLISLEEAQSRTSFTIRTPTWLPEGYSLQGVMVPPDLSSSLKNLPQPANAPQIHAPSIATLNYNNNAGDLLILSQMKRPQLELPGQLSREEVLLPVPRDKGSVQEATINGQPGQYVEMGRGRQLHWQDVEGVMYNLMSDTLDQATLIRIAESVK